jgi:hypothetical protein
MECFGIDTGPMEGSGDSGLSPGPHIMQSRVLRGEWAFHKEDELVMAVLVSKNCDKMAYLINWVY